MFPPAFTEIFRLIAGGRCELTLADIAARLDLPESLGTLGKMNRVTAVLSEHKLKCIPTIESGEVDTIRYITFDNQCISFDDALLSDSTGGEKAEVEFKSSLLFDYKKFSDLPEPKDASLCRSEEVLYSALKSIAAFSNCTGGRLYIGIADDATVLGIANDFRFTKEQNSDKWQLYLRDVIQSKFVDGAMLNDYVEITIGMKDSHEIARVDIYPRQKLTFLKKGDQKLLYRRQGNRTTLVDVLEIEEFLLKKWSVGLKTSK